jgi:hypothetical protein
MTGTKPRASRRLLAILITFTVVVLIVAVEQSANHDADQATPSSTESQQVSWLSLKWRSDVLR